MPAMRPASAKRQAKRQSPTRSRTMRSYLRYGAGGRPRIAPGASFAALAARGLTVPLYAHGLGADRFQVGALFSVATLAGAALSLPSGLLIDRFGARALLAFSLVVAAGSQLAAAATATVLPLFVWQVVGGLGAGAQQAALFSAVTESVKSGRLGRAMGWLTMSMQAGFFIGPSIAGVLLNWLDVRTDLAVTTALLVFTIPGGLAASGTRQSSRRGLALRDPLRSLFTQAAFLPVVIGLVAASLGWGTVGAFLPIFGKEALRLPSAQVGLLLALQAVAFGAMGVVFADLSAASTRGVTMGIYGTVLFLGLSAGPLLFGPVVQNYGYAAGFTACSVAAVALAIAMAAFHAEPLRRRAAVRMPPPAPGT